MPERPGPSLHLTLVDPSMPDGGGWAALQRTARRLCGADAAGVAPAVGPAGNGRRSELAALARRLRTRGGPVTLDTGSSHLAGAALVDAGGAMLWIERDAAPFEPKVIARLGWLAAGALDFLAAIAAEREEAELLLREVRHRCANDLHLVGSLLSHRARFADDPRIAAALDVVAGRVMMLSAARQRPPGDLVGALRACADALAAQAGDRGIEVELAIEGDCPSIDERRAAVLLLAANELTINALKHAFGQEPGGRVGIRLAADPMSVVLTVEDDGAAIPPIAAGRAGSGLDLIGRLVTGIRATLIPPPPGSKRFTIEMKVAPATADRRDK